MILIVHECSVRSGKNTKFKKINRLNYLSNIARNGGVLVIAYPPKKFEGDELDYKIKEYERQLNESGVEF